MDCIIINASKVRAGIPIHLSCVAGGIIRSSVKG